MSDELTRRSMLAALGVAAVGALGTEAVADDKTETTDYEEMNGIRVYKEGKKPPVPNGLKADFEVISPFGFKVTFEV